MKFLNRINPVWLVWIPGIIVIRIIYEVLNNYEVEGFIKIIVVLVLGLILKVIATQFEKKTKRSS